MDNPIVVIEQIQKAQLATKEVNLSWATKVDPLTITFEDGSFYTVPVLGVSQAVEVGSKVHY